jgi:hypothetical protein
MFCALRLVFGGTKGVGSHFHVLRAVHVGGTKGVGSQTFVLPDKISAVPRSSCPFFMFCAPELVLGGTESVGTRFHVLRSRNRFRRYRGRRVPFSCIALPDSFSAVPSASGPVFMFCTPGLVFGSNEGVSSLFHVFALPDIFSAVPGKSGPVFMFCAPGLVFCGAECVGSRFHVLRSRIHFRWYRRHRVPFSCFARPDSFSAVRRASGPVLMFCTPEIIFSGTEDVG